jgi:hypothetical protein
MPYRTNSNQLRRRPPRIASSRRLGRSVVATVLVAPSLLITACGSSKPATILNTEKVERAIEQSTLTQRQTRVNVTCPSGVHQLKGLTFACTAVFKGGTTRFVVAELDALGNVHYVAR